MKLSVRHDLKKFRRDLNRVQRRQVPFAASQALNDTAFKIRNGVAMVLWPRSVRVRARGFASAAFRVKKANKRSLEAAVYDRLNRALFKLQIEGGIKTPWSSTHIAIPTWNALTSTGRIKKDARFDNPNLFKMTVKARTRFGKGRPGLWLRTSKGLKLMYNLERKATVPASFPFYEFGQRTAAIHFPRYMDRRLKAALRTAR